MLNEVKHKPFRDNPYFEQYVKLLLSLHQAMREENEEEAERLREEMDEPGLHLNNEEIQWVKGLSADLYMFAEDESFRPLDRPQLQLISDIQAASERSEAGVMLQLLRKANFVKPEHRAWLRFRAYDMSGYYALSLLFLAYAADQAPDRSQYKFIILLKMLQQKDFHNARNVALEFIQSPDMTPQFMVIIAISLFSSTEDLSPIEAQPYVLQAIELTRSVLDSEQKQALRSDDALMAWMVMASCYFKLGDITNAVVSDNNALMIAPANPNAYELRGRHRLEVDRQGALEDFRSSVIHNSSVPFPYLFVIREALFQGNYREALDLSRKLLAITAHPSVHAQALEFLAIAYYGLDYPAQEVETAYRGSLELVPENPRRRENYNALKSAGFGSDNPVLLNLPTLTPEEIEIMSTEEVASSSVVLASNGLASALRIYEGQANNRFTENILREDYAKAA